MSKFKIVEINDIKVSNENDTSNKIQYNEINKNELSEIEKPIAKKEKIDKILKYLLIITIIIFSLLLIIYIIIPIIKKINKKYYLSHFVEYSRNEKDHSSIELIKRTSYNKNYSSYDLTKFLLTNQSQIKIIKGKVSKKKHETYDKEDILTDLNKAIETKVGIKNKIEIVRYNNSIRLGNYITGLSNTIYFCELLGCKSIIFDKKGIPYLNNSIFYTKYNMTIEPYRKVDCNLNNTICIDTEHFFYYTYKKLVPEPRYHVIKNEFFKNFQYLNTNPDDLFIHIRSGDIFKKYVVVHSGYSQPPFCFYEAIIDTFKFKNIYIFSNGDQNPLIDLILKKYSNAKFISGSLTDDINILLYARNVVVSQSSFAMRMLDFSDSLLNVFIYDLFSRLNFRLWNLNRDYREKYNIYVMKPTEEYAKEMKSWKFSEKQVNLMKFSKCNNELIKYNGN